MALIFVVTLAVSLGLTPLVRRVALRRGLVDVPGEERRVHAVAVPRLGGLAMYAAFAVGALFYFAMPDSLLPRLPEQFAYNNRFEEGRILLLLLGAGIMVAVMAVDDVRGIKPLPK